MREMQLIYHHKAGLFSVDFDYCFSLYVSCGFVSCDFVSSFTFLVRRKTPADNSSNYQSSS